MVFSSVQALHLKIEILSNADPKEMFALILLLKKDKRGDIKGGDYVDYEEVK
ncbi:MAG: hypothetical protein QM734_15735 [Cyclobacteriaceae bacterium]